MRQLSHLRNVLVSASHAQTPVQKLPRELLLHILALSAGPHAHARYTQFALVCQGWATVVLGTPSLWKRPTFRCRKSTGTLLTRSGEAPLDVCIDLREASEDEVEAATLAIKQIGRVQHLELTALPNALLPLFDALPPVHTMDKLETLSLSNHSVYPAHLALSHISAPRLAKLTLSDFEVSFTSPLLTNAANLVDLSILQSVARTADRPSISSILFVLKNSSGLESITLQNCLPEPAEGELTYAKVNLPYLSEIELEDTQASVAALLSCLTVPPTTTMRLIVQADPSDDESFTLFSTALASYLLSCASTAPKERVEVALNGKDVRLHFYDAGESTPSVDVSLTWRGLDDTRPARVIACVLGALPLDSLVQLCVADVLMTQESWRFVLRRTPSLQVLRAESDSLVGVFETLFAQPVFAPRMRTLTLARVSFTDADIMSAFVAFVRHWRTSKADALVAEGSFGAPEPGWTIETRMWHKDLEAIDLDRCGFASEDQIAQLKDAGMVLGGWEST